jgi:uroporphyrin-III C-methyltransferase
MRGVNQAIILATGHDPNEDGSIDWFALARTRQPIVLYMGLRNLDNIAAALIRGGLKRDTPAAVIASATLAQQQVLVSTLDRIGADARVANLAAPTMVVIGNIVHTRQQLQDTLDRAAQIAAVASRDAAPGDVASPRESSACEG